MKYQLLFLLILAEVIISCTSKENKPTFPPSNNCFVRYDSLFKDIDTSRMEINRYTDSAAIEVLDSKRPGTRGLLRFDENGNLRLYAFLQDEIGNTSFMLTYDSIGNRNREENPEVVLWDYFKTNDSIKFTFYLCALDRNYGSIAIESGSFKKENIQLFQTDYIKLIGATISINQADIDKKGKIYITGVRGEKCSRLEEDFIDSTIVPFAQLE